MKAFASSLAVATLSLVFYHCSSPPEADLPPAFRREGLVSSNTYQVVVSVQAGSESEARNRGRNAGIERAYDSIMREPFISVRLTPNGRNEIKRMVEENAEVVRVHDEGRDDWTVVLQVYRRGLKEYLKRMY